MKILGQSCGKRDIEATVARSTEWLRSLREILVTGALSKARSGPARPLHALAAARGDDDSPAGERGHLHQPVEKNGNLAEENSPSAVRDGGEAVILGRAAEAEVLLSLMNIGAREHGPRLSLLALGPTGAGRRGSKRACISRVFAARVLREARHVGRWQRGRAFRERQACLSFSLSRCSASPASSDRIEPVLAATSAACCGTVRSRGLLSLFELLIDEVNKRDSVSAVARSWATARAKIARSSGTADDSARFSAEVSLSAIISGLRSDVSSLRRES